MLEGAFQRCCDICIPHAHVQSFLVSHQIKGLKEEKRCAAYGNDPSADLLYLWAPGAEDLVLPLAVKVEKDSAHLNLHKRSFNLHNLLYIPFYAIMWPTKI